MSKQRIFEEDDSQMGWSLTPEVLDWLHESGIDEHLRRITKETRAYAEENNLNPPEVSLLYGYIISNLRFAETHLWLDQGEKRER